MPKPKRAAYKGKGGDKKHAQKITLNPEHDVRQFDERATGAPPEWRADHKHDTGQFTGQGEPGLRKK